MGLLDILNGMQNGPGGQREPTPPGKSGGMSPLMMALLGLLAYKAIKGGGLENMFGKGPGSNPTLPPPAPGTTTAGGPGEASVTSSVECLAAGVPARVRRVRLAAVSATFSVALWVAASGRMPAADFPEVWQHPRWPARRGGCGRRAERRPEERPRGSAEQRARRCREVVDQSGREPRDLAGRSGAARSARTRSTRCRTRPGCRASELLQRARARNCRTWWISSPRTAACRPTTKTGRWV